MGVLAGGDRLFKLGSSPQATAKTRLPDGSLNVLRKKVGFFFYFFSSEAKKNKKTNGRVTKKIKNLFFTSYVDPQKLKIF